MRLLIDRKEGGLRTFLTLRGSENSAKKTEKKGPMRLKKKSSEEVAGDFRKDWLKGLHHKEKLYLGFVGLP